ncbi:RmlC-like cupin domain-containing protein [Lineolata rhizophorae]|uniref:Mannose-6-phosphate isomerase n=1 Tax=Lineolata rhizophorae TaxID=578093 RepID=A0A6A6P9C2_9PEZI|nr:RmlC-like cupin domain-containing protein [Lineolata rhizophorae]
MTASVLQLKCYCNEYPWGKKGNKSMAARLCANTPRTDFTVEEDTPYAEMWMGTYPSLPSYVLSTDEELQKVIDKDPTGLLGEPVQKKFGPANLPFLPKILSIEKALPLQLHPNIGLAESLHAREPNKFTDPNHKPEIGLALTEFEAFAGFKPLKDIERLLTTLEPLNKFIAPIRKTDYDDQSLKFAVHEMLSLDPDEVRQTEDALMKIPRENFGKDEYVLDMLPRLQEQYDKTDPGTLVALILMNYLRLPPGSAVYVPADAPHAWLHGDIVECMARSNNVLNTGFCPRASRDDVDLFCSVLTFTPHDINEALISSEPFEKSSNGKTRVFRPPMSEFSLLEVSIHKGEKEAWQKFDGPGIFILTQGSGVMRSDGKEWKLEEGYTFFVGVGTELAFEANSEFQGYFAYVE